MKPVTNVRESERRGEQALIEEVTNMCMQGQSFLQ